MLLHKRQTEQGYAGQDHQHGAKEQPRQGIFWPRLDLSRRERFAHRCGDGFIVFPRAEQDQHRAPTVRQRHRSPARVVTRLRDGGPRRLLMRAGLRDQAGARHAELAGQNAGHHRDFVRGLGAPVDHLRFSRLRIQAEAHAHAVSEYDQTDEARQHSNPTRRRAGQLQHGHDASRLARHGKKKGKQGGHDQPGYNEQLREVRQHERMGDKMDIRLPGQRWRCVLSFSHGVAPRAGDT